jgi:hypothetical protein
MSTAIHHSAGRGPHHLMLGTDVTRLPTAPPPEPRTPDRDRLLAAFAAHGLQPFEAGPPGQGQAGQRAESHEPAAAPTGR